MKNGIKKIKSFPTNALKLNSEAINASERDTVS